MVCLLALMGTHQMPQRLPIVGLYLELLQCFWLTSMDILKDLEYQITYIESGLSVLYSEYVVGPPSWAYGYVFAIGKNY